MSHDLTDSAFVAAQHLAPQHLMSRAAGSLANTTNPAIKRRFINWFITRYGVDMNEALEPDPEAYPNFNAFFTRALKDGARPLSGGEGTVISPADGTLSQCGEIRRGRLFQAKGQTFSAAELTGEAEPTLEPFEQGLFATIYLSPRDYHRVHMPLTGTLEKMTFIPGRLFSVNPVTTEKVPRLFARNERVVAWFRTEWGPMAVVLVGAMIVAGIETVWAGPVAPAGRRVWSQDYPANGSKALTLERGQEMGRFHLGSTVIVMLPRGCFGPESDLESGQDLRMGNTLARAL
jgi:phosphatidylserine decarboxylase